MLRSDFSRPARSVTADTYASMIVSKPLSA